DSAAVAHLSAVPFYNSKLRTTCVATMMAAGHAENALPQSARVTINCRILPGEPASEVEATLRRLAGDDPKTLRATNTPVPRPPHTTAAGHAENALPQAARVTINCRILPGEPASEVEATLRRLAGDDRMTLRETNTPVPSPPSPLTAAIMGPIEQLAAEQFPNVPVVPVMEAGATDGLFLRNAGIPTYGVSAVFEERSEEHTSELQSPDHLV